MEWYVVHIYSGFEEKVKISIEDGARRRNLADKIEQIMIPTETVVELKGGKKIEKEKKFYPGYILIKMELNNETWHVISSTPRVTGFVGGENPAPLPQEEVDVILQQIEEGPAARVTAQFDKGDVVRITDGSFANFNGVVDEVDGVHNKLKIMVSVFGRQTSVELDFLQVEKN
jgi:transcriptional antiterminator NusG